MLIVVVIIGILSVALIPRLTSYMARTRDLKRQSDLRNIAVAIEMYKNDYGEFPRRGEIYSSYPSASPYVGSVGGLSSVLSEYLKKIPRDPNKNQSIKRLYSACLNDLNVDSCKGAWPFLKDGEYFYQVNVFSNFAVVLAKVETLELANFV